MIRYRKPYSGNDAKTERVIETNRKRNLPYVLVPQTLLTHGVLAALLIVGGCRKAQDTTPSGITTTTLSLPASRTYSEVYLPVNLTISPDGRWLACRQTRGAENPSSVMLFDATTGVRRDTKPLAIEVNGELYWSGANRLVASGSAAQVWKVGPQGKLTPVATFGQITKVQPSSQISPQFGSSPFTSSVPINGKIADRVQFTVVSAVHQLGARLISRHQGQDSIESKQLIELFDPKSKRVIRNITPPNYRPANSTTLAFPQSGVPRLLVVEFPGEFSFRFSLWEPRSGRRLWQQTVPGLNPQIEFTSDARFLIVTQVTGSHGRDIFPLHDTFVFDTQTGKKVRTLPTQRTVYAATISGNTLVSYGTEHRVEKKQNWTSLQYTDWRSGKKILHCWMPAGVGQIQTIAASSKAGTVFGNRDGLILWRTADLKRAKSAYKTVQGAYQQSASGESSSFED